MFLQDKAAFSLSTYSVLDFSYHYSDYESLEMDLKTKGDFNEEEATFHVQLDFTAKSSKDNSEILNCQMTGSFIFKDKITIEDVPSYFYINSVAILFPYLRAFISTLSVQANHKLIIIPTMNLQQVGAKFKDDMTK